MAGKVEAKLKELGITLPQAPTPAANYVPFVRSGALVFIAGQIPISEGVVQYAGLAGNDVSVEDAYRAARLCGINIISQAKAACGGDLDKVTRIVNLSGFVASPASFTDHAKVLNGVSDLMVEVFGDAGRHSRAAMGSPSLPRNVTVEVAAVIETA
jgi:enamine deaminase RidA (YjgF/YER057c/UK114 family)